MLSYEAAFFVLLANVVLTVAAFDNSRYDNVVLYWGQNSYGAVQGDDPANFQKRLSYYCNDNAVDVFPVAFLHVFFGTGGAPSINLANTCNSVDNATFPGTSLPNCASLAGDITTCQSKGKLVTLSLGGATGAVGFQSDAQATTFAQTVWDMFLGGSSSTRPFGNAILDGVDLDIEGGTSDHYEVFISKIRSLSSGSSKKYYVTAAPQCIYPDAALGGVLNKVAFDAIYVQFYNNPCGLPHFAEANNWNFGIWDNWARAISTNKNVKVYIGAPGAPRAAGGGYVPIETLKQIAVQMRKSFPSFGGVMLWDASQAYWNSRYDLAIKNALTAAGGTGFIYPACSAPAYIPGTGYSGGSKVTYNGYIWQAKWWASSTPSHNPNGEWSAISACGGAPIPTSTSTSTPTSPPTTSTSASQTPTPTPGGNCSGVGVWSSATVYTKGLQAVYNSHLWTAQWWTQNDTPGGSAGAWADDGPCGSTKKAADISSARTSSTSSDNLAVYWGQDGAGQQQSLGFYCNDDTIDVIPLAFLYTFFGQGGMPVVDFSNICSNGNRAFGGTSLADCSYMASDIQKCQAKGKLVTLSLGGATANVGFGSAGEAASFAKTIWNMFLGGSGPIRPFGNAILDGVDLDIENGSSMYYDTFVSTLRSLMQGSAKKFYVTAAPQCPFPDAKVGQALSNAYFDAVYVQFYNNYCETSRPSEFNFATWDNWAKTQSPNKNVKVYIGAPGSPAAAGSGYVPAQSLIDMARDVQKKYSSFGGIMLWDADTAYNNNRFHNTVKNGIRNGGSAPPDTTNPQPTSTRKPINPTKTPRPGPTSTNTSSSSWWGKAVSPATPLPDPRASGRVRRPSSWTDNMDADDNDELTKLMRRNSRFFKKN